MHILHERTICLFSCYFNGKTIPYYIKYYIEELKKHCSHIIFITNQKTLLQSEITLLNNHNIQIMLVANEGYDFGMWNKAMHKYDVLKFERVLLVNDSCVLFKPLTTFFDWVDKSNLDCCGIVSSERFGFHIQSYFIVINKNAIEPLYNYFKKNGIINDYQKVIQTYEIGLSSHFKNLNLKIGAQFFSKTQPEIFNPSMNVEAFIEAGIPMIKKKIIFRSYRLGEYLSLLRMDFNIDPGHYIKIIQKNNEIEKLIDFNLVLNQGSKQNRNDIFLYQLTLFLYNIAKRSHILTFVFHQIIILKRRLRGKTNPLESSPDQNITKG